MSEDYVGVIINYEKGQPAPWSDDSGKAEKLLAIKIAAALDKIVERVNG